MNGVHHALPSRESRGAVHCRYIIISAGRGMIDVDALSDNQSRATIGAAGIIIRHILLRHALWGMPPRHRSHGDEVGQKERDALERAEQRLELSTSSCPVCGPGVVMCGLSLSIYRDQA